MALHDTHLMIDWPKQNRMAWFSPSYNNDYQKYPWGCRGPATGPCCLPPVAQLRLPTTRR